METKGEGKQTESLEVSCEIKIGGEIIDNKYTKKETKSQRKPQTYTLR